MKQTLTIIAILLTTLVTGCAGVNQMYSAAGASALVDARAAEDNVVRTWSVAACATPLSALIRNPQIVPALQALCLPGGALSNPATLMQAIPAKP